MEKFRKLKLSTQMLEKIGESGFDSPTEIQEKSIPLALEGKDILGSSATGSGKTLAFGIPIIEKIKGKGGVQALILTPTRELAIQIAKNLGFFSKSTGLKITEIYGGVSIEPQINALRTSDIVVGTPGRILDHLTRRTLNLDNVGFLVLDEADRMLDMGFIEDVQKIINECPQKRQTFLFSATINNDIERIVHRYMKKPVRIDLDSYVDPSKLKQEFYDVPQNKKFSLLGHFLKKERKGPIMVFCNTRSNTELLARNLKRHGIEAREIHGGMAQNKRNMIIELFHSRKIPVLICTDVATRGLDIKNVSHIYNYDIPKDSKDYIHRIGRTARAGKEGVAINLISPRDYDNFRRVCLNPDLKIESAPLPQIQDLPVKFRNFSRTRRFDSRERSTHRNFGGNRARGQRRNFGRIQGRRKHGKR